MRNIYAKTISSNEFHLPIFTKEANINHFFIGFLVLCCLFIIKVVKRHVLEYLPPFITKETLTPHFYIGFLVFSSYFIVEVLKTLICHSCCKFVSFLMRTWDCRKLKKNLFIVFGWFFSIVIWRKKTEDFSSINSSKSSKTLHLLHKHK